MSLKLVNWNVQWATPRSRRSSDILTRIAEHFPEVICLTETHVALLPHQGHLICSQPDYGYPIKEGRRKVLLWSREPWHQIEMSESIPCHPVGLCPVLPELPRAR